ncbi:MAG: DNA polymerase IV [Clostridia bacterium]|nr:DNA polymerase IV [Clostridia bacterium]
MERVILLVDMNAFFISCETTRRPELAGRPAAVAGDPKNRSGIILTANYEARKFGVKTTMVLHQAEKLCPNLQLVPPDHAFYEEKSREVMGVLSRYTPIIEQNSIDEAWLDISGCEALFGDPVELSTKIMNELKDKLGLPCSIGISENKFLAKMAAEMKKPMGITWLKKEDLPGKLWILPAGAMYGVGKHSEEKLKRLGIFTIGQLAASSPELLMKELGKWGSDIQKLANGIDSSTVAPRSVDDIKSIGRSTTLDHDISDMENAKRILYALADEVGSTARKHKKKGRTVQITIKYSTFQTITRQKKLTHTFLTKKIYEAGLELLKENWSPKKPVRLIGISISDFDMEAEQGQLSLFDNIKDTDNSKEEKLELAIDEIRNKHGISMVKPAVLLRKIDGES